jgi:hypothetical protein
VPHTQEKQQQAEWIPYDKKIVAGNKR